MLIFYFKVCWSQLFSVWHLTDVSVQLIDNMNWHIFYLRISIAIKIVVYAQVVMLVLAWKLDAQSMGYFTLQEWLRGMGSLQYVSCLLFCLLAHCSQHLLFPCCVSIYVFQACPSFSVEQEVQSMSKALFCCCQVRLHREAEELTRLPEICPKRQHQF